jgi:beta-lactamase regulating signal transducer with metallopeptidase domain
MPLKLALSTILTGSTIASLGLTIIGIILVLFVFCTVLLFFEYRSEKIRQKHYENYLNKKELGFVTKLYNSFREKYCSKIEFVD